MKLLDSLTTTILNSLPIFATILIVLLLRNRKILSTKDKATLHPLIFKFVLPFFVFKALYNLQINPNDVQIVLIILASLLVLLIIFFIFAKALKLESKIRNTILICMLGFSAGSFAYPFIQLNFNQEVFGRAVFIDISIFVFLMLVAPILGSFLSAGEEKIKPLNILKSIFSDIILLTVTFTAGLNTLHIEVSPYLTKAVDFISQSFIFLTLIYVTLSLKLPNLSKIKTIVFSFLFRNILLIALVLLISFPLAGDVVMKQAIILTLFVPFSTFAMVYTKKYNLDEETIAQLSVFSQIIMILIYPVVVVFALQI